VLQASRSSSLKKTRRPRKRNNERPLNPRTRQCPTTNADMSRLAILNGSPGPWTADQTFAKFLDGVLGSGQKAATGEAELQPADKSHLSRPKSVLYGLSLAGGEVPRVGAGATGLVTETGLKFDD